jgi:VanZ family protein
VNHAVRKAGHIFFYGVLAVLAWRADRRWFVALGVVLLVASIDEYRQSLTLARTGTPWDVVLDVCSALLFILAIRRARR